MKSVYLVKDYSNIRGNTLSNIIGIYSTLEKAQKAYQEAIDIIHKEHPVKDTWYENKNTQSTNMYFELMDNTIAPEFYYQLELTKEELNKTSNI